MLRLIPLMKLDQLEPGAAGGGAPASKVIPPPAAQAGAPGSPSDEVETDDLGYELPPKTDEEKKEGEKKVVAEGSVKKTEEPVKPATGYGDEPPKVEEPATPPVEEPIKTDLGFELKLEGLPKAEAEKVIEFAKANELSEKAAQAFADFRKSQIKSAEEGVVAAKKAAEQERNRIRSEWHKELKNDPKFGGEKFAYNIALAEKVVDQLMPHTKKMLTERGTMLPPYVMRDLVKIGEHFNPTQQLVQGDPPAPEVPEEDDALAFYGSQKA